MTTVQQSGSGGAAAANLVDEEATLLHPGVQELDGITLRASRGYDPFEGWSLHGQSRVEAAAWMVVVLIGVLLGLYLPQEDAAVPRWAATASAIMGTARAPTGATRAQTTHKIPHALQMMPA